MLFNSYPFILLFLPIILAVTFLVSRLDRREYTLGLLLAASLFFYGSWNPPYLLLLVGSICFNHVVGQSLLRLRAARGKWLLVTGIGANLAAVGYFKYSNFFVDNFNGITGLGFRLDNVVLPLAISFFTFQQIAYLVDAYRGQTKQVSLLEYSLFVSFFPQLIAGPIVHHADVLDQYRSKRFGRFDHEAIAVGLTIFFLGLFKKVVLADGIAPYADAGFDAVGRGETLSFFEGWGTTLAYSFQLYFDFSGYSDMAIGLARLFGLRLPVNFLSPYRATNIIDFWRRWHVTLSRFLREYLYFPLGGSRKGGGRRYFNLMIVMLLGGLWHGAAWTFVAWGLVHGCYLVINHAWHALRRSVGLGGPSGSWLGCWAGRLITFAAVTAAWALFRADSITAGIGMVTALTGLHGFALPETYLGYFDAIVPFGSALSAVGLEFRPTPYLQGIDHIFWVTVSFVIVMVLPNVSEFVDRHEGDAISTVTMPARQWVLWRPSPSWAIFVVVVMIWSVAQMNEVHVFLYYQF